MSRSWLTCDVEGNTGGLCMLAVEIVDRSTSDRVTLALPLDRNHHHLPRLTAALSFTRPGRYRWAQCQLRSWIAARRAPQFLAHVKNRLVRRHLHCPHGIYTTYHTTAHCNVTLETVNHCTLTVDLLDPINQSTNQYLYRTSLTNAVTVHRTTM